MIRMGPVPDAASKARLRLWLRLLAVSRMVEGELRERLRALDTTLPRFDVMAALSRAPDGLTCRGDTRAASYG